MNETNSAGPGQVRDEAHEAREAVDGLGRSAEVVAGSIGAAFEKAGVSLSRSMMRAAADGKVSLAEVARMVLDLVNQSGRGNGSGGGLADAIAAVGKSFAGARADGGPVSGGGAYLVGERGPEVFRPSGSGTIEPGFGGPSVTVNVSVEGGAEGLLRSEAQIARMLARATALGVRGL